MNKTAQRILATALLPAVLATSTGRADILAQWDFESNPPTGAGTTNGPYAASVGTGSATGFHLADATAWSNPVGNGSGESWSSNTWDTGDYYQFQTSTVGFEGITLAWDQTRSGTGPGTFDLAYSLNGTDFTVFVDDYIVDAISWSSTTAQPGSNKTADLSAALDLNNAANVYFRLVATGPGSGTAGTNRVDNFTINGVTITIVADPAYWDVNGSVAGIGGPGEWTGVSATWNDAITGTDATVALDPAKTATFGGIPGIVVIGNGATANAGVEVTVDGYQFVGGTLAMGGTAPAFKVTEETDTAEVAASLSGTGGLRKTGAGTLILSGDNSSTLTGTITIPEGTLSISADNQLGAAANSVTLSGGTLQTTASLILSATRALAGTGGLDIAPGTTLTVAGDSSFGSVTLTNSGQLEFSSATPSTGSITFEQPATVSAPNGTLAVNGNLATTYSSGTATISPNLDLGSAARIIDVADGSAAVDLLIQGNISGGPNARLNKLGAGTLELTGDHGALAGGVALGNTAEPLAPGGKLIVQFDTALGGTALTPGATLFFNSGTLHGNSGAALVFNNAVSFAAGRLENGATFSGSPMTFLGTASLFSPSGSFFQHRIQVDTDVTFAGGFVAPLTPPPGTSTGVTIAGTGTLFLPNAINTVEQAITVDGGNLSISGGLTSTTISVINGGTLSGASDALEQVAVVNVGSGGVISPGEIADATATLRHFNFSLEDGGAFLAELGGTAAGEFDQLTVANEIILAGALQIELLPGYLPIPGDQFTIILNEGANAVSGTFAGMEDDAAFALFGTAFAVDYNGGDGNDVVLSVIPEPGSCALLLAGAAVFARRRRLGVCGDHLLRRS